MWKCVILLLILSVGAQQRRPTLKLVVPCWKRKGRTLEEWFKTAMVSSCDVDYLCFQELEYADARGDEALMRKYLAPGTFFAGMVDSNEPFCCGIAKLLLDMCTKYNVSSNSLYFGHIGDESRPPFPYLEEFYSKFKKVYRNFWWQEELFLRLRQSGKLGWFPIGPLTRGEANFSLVPSSQRAQPLYFSGGRKTNTRRPGQVGYIRETLNQTVGGSFGGSSRYIDDLRNSVFCINIRGTSAECFRFYEAIEAGCIPLMMHRFHDFDYTSQHEQQYSLLLEVPWEKAGIGYPFMWVADAKELRTKYDSLMRSGPAGLAKLDMMQRDVMSWYDAIKRHYNSIISKDICMHY